MRSISYFILFITSLTWAITNLFKLGNYYLSETNENFMLLFLFTFISLAGTILFSYAWREEER